MARLASPETVRFTAAQRDALIDLAARLQAEQEATVGMDELARAAEGAGVDPRFLSEAARQLETPTPASRGEIGPVEAILALVGLAAFDALFLGIMVRGWFFPIAGSLRLPLLAGGAFLFAWGFGRSRALRWVAPLGPVAIWSALGILGGALHFVRGGGVWWHHFPQTILAFALVQAFASGLASFLRRDP